MEVDLTQVNDDMTMANAETVLGVKIDPNHTWTAIKEYSITVTADAPLEDVAQVKILTESPFGNDEAEVLNTVDCHKGDVVTMRYETPIDLTQLVAACVSSKGICYIKVFNVGDSSVKFGGSSSANTRASSDDYPTSIKLGSGIPSFNAQRAQASLASDYHNVKIMDNGNDGLSGRARYYDVWNDGSWANDVLWSHSSVEGGGWGIEDGTIFKPVSDVGDLTTLSTICNNYIKKTDENNKKVNNWKGVAQGNAYFSVNNNYLESTGGPTTIIPVQMNSTEGIHNTVYYYYFNPGKLQKRLHIWRRKIELRGQPSLRTLLHSHRQRQQANHCYFSKRQGYTGEGRRYNKRHGLDKSAHRYVQCQQPHIYVF